MSGVATPWIFAASAMLGTLGLGMIGIWAADRAHRQRVRQRFERIVQEQRAGGELPATDAMGTLASLGSWFGERLGGLAIDAELPRMLARAGWRGRQALAIYTGVRLLLALGGVWLAGTLWATSGRELPGSTLLMAMFMAGALGYLAPGWMVAARARRRARSLVEDTHTFSQVLALLFESGLSVEQSLSTVVRDRPEMLRTLASELEPTMRQIAAGRDRESALEALGEDLGIVELRDLIGLLTRIDRYGGEARASLESFAGLLSERRRTETQETLSRMSARMTVVMVGFLLPALLVVVGGPGFLSIIRALER